MQSRNHGTGCCGRIWLDSGSSMACPQASGPHFPGVLWGQITCQEHPFPCGPDARSCGAPSREHAGLYTFVDDSLFTFRSNRGWIG